MTFLYEEATCRKTTEGFAESCNLLELSLKV